MIKTFKKLPLVMIFSTLSGMMVKVQDIFIMINPTKKPRYIFSELKYLSLRDSFFGSLIAGDQNFIDQLESSISVLEEESAKKIWNKTFGDADQKNAISQENWSMNLFWSSSGDWLEYYNNGDSEPVEQQLRSLVDWPQDQVIIFLKGPCDCIIVKWASFIENWLLFFEFDDDGPYIVPIDRDEVVRICPNGTYLKGIVVASENSDEVVPSKNSEGKE